jgi:hypothetical protein
MPPGWKSPFKVNLYQVVVEPTSGGAPHFVGPAMDQEAAGNFRDAIEAKIKAGAEKHWSNPMLIPVKTV